MLKYFGKQLNFRTFTISDSQLSHLEKANWALLTPAYNDPQLTEHTPAV